MLVTGKTLKCQVCGNDVDELSLWTDTALCGGERIGHENCVRAWQIAAETGSTEDINVVEAK